MKNEITNELKRAAIKMLDDFGKTSKKTVAELVHTGVNTLKNSLEDMWGFPHTEKPVKKNKKKNNLTKE